MTLSDLERLDARRPFFGGYRMCVRSVWRRTTKFGMVTRGMIIGVSRQREAPSQRGGAPVFHFCKFPSYAHTVWPKATKFSTVTRGEGRVAEGHARSLSPVPPILGLLRTPTCYDTQKNKFCTVIIQRRALGIIDSSIQSALYEVHLASSSSPLSTTAENT